MKKENKRLLGWQMTILAIFMFLTSPIWVYNWPSWFPDGSNGFDIVSYMVYVIALVVLCFCGIGLIVDSEDKK